MQQKTTKKHQGELTWNWDRCSSRRKTPSRPSLAFWVSFAREDNTPMIPIIIVSIIVVVIIIIIIITVLFHQLSTTLTSSSQQIGFQQNLKSFHIRFVQFGLKFPQKNEKSVMRLCVRSMRLLPSSARKCNVLFSNWQNHV